MSDTEYINERDAMAYEEAEAALASAVADRKYALLVGRPELTAKLAAGTGPKATASVTDHMAKMFETMGENGARAGALTEADGGVLVLRDAEMTSDNDIKIFRAVKRYHEIRLARTKRNCTLPANVTLVGCAESQTENHRKRIYRLSKELFYVVLLLVKIA